MTIPAVSGCSAHRYPDAALPERTSLQRGAKELLLQGKPLGSGLGLLKL